MKRIIFVDDEQGVLEGLQRMLRPMRNEWDMAFAHNGMEALQILAKGPVDVLVTDMRMPGMDGVTLLAEVMKLYPQIVRIVLSGHADQEMIIKSAGLAHQYLSKPCTGEILKNTVNRAFNLRELLVDKSLKQLISRMNSLPSIPTLYVQLTELLRSPDASIQKVGQIIAKDMGMTAKVLQLVNSAFFGIRRQISNPVDASIYLGLDTIKSLVFSINVFSQFDQSKVAGFSIQTLWKHSMTTGTFAHHLAKLEKLDPKVTDDMLMAGMLHDVGKLVLSTNLPKQYDEAMRRAQAKKITSWDAEREVFGATHAEVGAYLLWLWGLPDPIIEAITFHHCPAKCQAQVFSPLAVVHVADALEHEGRPGNDKISTPPLDMEYLTKLGLAAKLNQWREVFKEVVQKGDKA